MTGKKKFALIFVLVTAGIGVYAIRWGGLGATLKVGTAFKAKNLASSIFVSNRDEADVIKNDLSFGPLALISTTVDYGEKSVTGSALGLVKTKVIYREGLGCTMVNGIDEDAIHAQTATYQIPVRPDTSVIAWPMGDLDAEAVTPDGVDRAKLEAALDEAFSEAGLPEGYERATRAMLIVHGGKIVGERFAPGFGNHTPLGSYSMTKSVTNALVGILVAQGKLDLHAPAPIPEWSDPQDPRSKITLDQLMRMSSGLQFQELYEDYTSDVVQMLYRESDAGLYAASKPLAAEPDGKWSYSSGTSNVIQRIIRSTFQSHLDYLNFPREALFEPLGMHSAVIEPDASGTYVGSSFMYASARDWARFGMLYLNDGVWEGERILPEGWVEYSTTPTPLAPKGQYGAQFWLNAGDPDNPEDRPWPSAPTDTYAAQGFESQRVMVIPSKDLVIVRQGQSRPEAAWDTDAMLRNVLASIEG